MKFRMIVLLLAFVAVVTSCTNQDKEESQLAVSSKITLDNVISAIKSEGVELHPLAYDGKSHAINDVKPVPYNIVSAQPEQLYIYIFDSEQERTAGLQTFDGMREYINWRTFPMAYEQKNALVIYFSLHEENTKFGNEIQTAMQKL
jgi:hypothetical protein